MHDVIGTSVNTLIIYAYEELFSNDSKRRKKIFYGKLLHSYENIFHSTSLWMFLRRFLRAQKYLKMKFLPSVEFFYRKNVFLLAWVLLCIVIVYVQESNLVAYWELETQTINLLAFLSSLIWKKIFYITRERNLNFFFLILIFFKDIFKIELLKRKTWRANRYILIWMILNTLNFCMEFQTFEGFKSFESKFDGWSMNFFSWIIKDLNLMN